MSQKTDHVEVLDCRTTLVVLAEHALVLTMLELTCVTRNLVRRSGSRCLSLDRIMSNMSPCSFSMTTKTRSGVSNMPSRLTIPGW